MEIKVKRSLDKRNQNLDGVICNDKGEIIAKFLIHDQELIKLHNSGFVKDTQNAEGENIYIGKFIKV